MSDEDIVVTGRPGHHRWIGDNLTEDLSVSALAARVTMTLRHFARVFHVDTGITPAAYVERLRLELARRLLEQTDHTPRDIARASGLRLGADPASRVPRAPGHHPGRVPAPIPADPAGHGIAP